MSPRIIPQSLDDAMGANHGKGQEGGVGNTPPNSTQTRKNVENHPKIWRIAEELLRKLSKNVNAQ